MSGARQTGIWRRPCREVLRLLAQDAVLPREIAHHIPAVDGPNRPSAISTNCTLGGHILPTRRGLLSVQRLHVFHRAPDVFLRQLHFE
jgi:hypothetical protein